MEPTGNIVLPFKFCSGPGFNSISPDVKGFSLEAQYLLVLLVDCVVPENIHTPPTEGIGISWGGGGFCEAKKIKKCMKLNWNFQKGGGS